MSGGSYDYVCFKIKEIEIRDADFNVRRHAFQRLLHLVAEAMHDIEWVDSCDYGQGDENKAIDACFNYIAITKAELLKIIHEKVDKINETTP
jgi:protein-tyrosine phosphatase